MSDLGYHTFYLTVGGVSNLVITNKVCPELFWYLLLPLIRYQLCLTRCYDVGFAQDTKEDFEKRSGTNIKKILEISEPPIVIFCVYKQSLNEYLTDQGTNEFM